MSSLNEKLSKTFTALKQTITSMNQQRNDLLARKIKTEYFSDVRYAKITRMMDECMAHMEHAVQDMNMVRNRFVVRREVCRDDCVDGQTGTDNVMKTRDGSAACTDKQTGTDNVVKTRDGSTARTVKRNGRTTKTRKRRAVVRMKRGQRLKEKSTNTGQTAIDK